MVVEVAVVLDSNEAGVLVRERVPEGEVDAKVSEGDVLGVIVVNCEQVVGITFVPLVSAVVCTTKLVNGEVGADDVGLLDGEIVVKMNCVV